MIAEIGSGQPDLIRLNSHNVLGYKAS